jgi:multiple sugar transport system permease protein
MATLGERELRQKQAAPKRGLGRQRRQEVLWGLLCVAPAVLGFLIWQLGPIVASLLIAFTDWRIAGTPNWVGLANFEHMLTADRLFSLSMRVTAYYTLGSVPLSMIVAFALALLLNQQIKGLPVFRTIFYLPAVVPLIASSVLWLWLFNPNFGLLNAALDFLGLPRSQWIYSSDTVIPSLILMSVWSVGPMMIIFLAGLQGVPRQLYEAVEVDGGNAWHRLWHITIPMLTPTILFNLVLSIIGTMQTFVQPYIMTGGGPNNASLLYVLYIYRKAFLESQMGYASALAWVLFVVIAILTFLVFRSSSRWVYYEGGDR